MPETSVAQVHYARLLENLSIDYMPKGLVAEELVPVVPVVHENDKYVVWNRDDRMSTVDDLRPDGVRARQVDFGWTYAGYFTEERALEVKLTDRERDNADNILQLQLSKVRGVQAKLLINQEIRIAGMFANTANYASTNVVNIGSVATNQFNNASFTGSIEQVIDSAKETVRIQLGGELANRLVIPKAVAMVVKRDAKIRDLIKFTHSDLLSGGDLPPVLWDLEVRVPAASYNTAIEGATGNMTDVWGKHMWVMYRTDNPGLNQINFGYIFRVKGLQVKTWREEPIDTTFFRPFYNQTEKIVSPYAGYFMQNVIA